MKRRKYVKTLTALGVFTTATGVSTAQSNWDITGIISKARVEANDHLGNFYEHPFFSLTETTTDDIENGVLNYALDSPSYRVDETLIREDENGRKQFVADVGVYLIKFDRDQFQRHLEKRIFNQDLATQSSERDVAILGSDIQSVDEYRQRLEDLRREAEKEAENQIQNSLNSQDVGLMSLNGSKGEVVLGDDTTFTGDTFNVYDEGAYTPGNSREDIHRTTDQGDQRVHWGDRVFLYKDELLMNSELSVWPTTVGHSSCWMYCGKSFDVIGKGEQTADVTIDLRHRSELTNAGGASGSADGQLIIREARADRGESKTDLWSYSLGDLGVGTPTVKKDSVSVVDDYHFTAGTAYEVIIKIKQSASAGFYGGATIDQGVAVDGGYGPNAPAQSIAVHDISIDWRE